MTEGPNPEQQRLINQLEGIYLVDAGPGTGKTYTITRRYAHILDETDTEPGDILLTTFTENGAATMQERIIEHCNYDRKALRDAPISTFHSFCNDLLQRHGVNAPQELGIDSHLPASTRIIENRFLEEQEFRRFYSQFRDRNGQHQRFYRIIDDPAQLLELVNSLASKGVFPTASGWFRDTASYLDGNLDAFLDSFEEANTPNQGRQGKKNSDLKRRLSRYDRKLYGPEAPSKAELRAGENTVPQRFAEEAFNEDREDLKQFVNDIYHSYIEYALDRNYLNFQFLQMFAYVLLIRDEALQEQEGFHYVMLDEFQDTNEIQFKIAMLLAREGNLAAVGDWKQSIFSFQYASVDNILSFQDRLQRYREELNRDRERIDYPVDSPTEISLVTNYRSSQHILDTAEHALTIEATYRENLEAATIRERITTLQADEETDATGIEALTSPEEHEAILQRIQNIVQGSDYMIDGEQPEYSDITVLVRRRETGRELKQLADEYRIPAAFEGGIELFTTDPALLLLAWLRILRWGDSRRGWAVVLDEAGYMMEEIEQFLDAGRYPADMQDFREQLEEKENIGAIAQHIFDRYGFDSGITARIIDVLQQGMDDGQLDLAATVRFIEDAVENGTAYDVDTRTDADAVTIQTIHSAKGSEYPVVFIADMNRRHFPSTQSSGLPIYFSDPIGLRQRKVWRDSPAPYTYDNWHTEILNKTLTGAYDEERRLLYVAMTRAERYLFLTATEGEESRFFSGLPLEPSRVEPSITPNEQLPATDHEIDYHPAPTHAPQKRSAHAIMDLDKRGQGGKGKAFGDRLHTFAEAYALGNEPDPGDEDDYRHVQQFIDRREGELKTEETILLPLEAEDRTYVLEGVIDLLHITDDSVEVIDFKTDRTRERTEAYRKQVSVYLHAAQKLYPDREVNGIIFYTDRGEEHNIDPVPKERLAELLERQ